jgi:hypothetical protein
MVEDDRVNLLRVTMEHMESLTGADTPNPDSAVIRATDEGVTMSGNGANRMRVSGQHSNEVRAVGLMSWGASLDISTGPNLRKSPDPELTVPGAGDYERLLGLHDGLSTGISPSLGGHQDLQATDSTSVSIEYLLAKATFDIPDANRSVSRARHQHVAFIL